MSVQRGIICVVAITCGVRGAIHSSASLADIDDIAINGVSCISVFLTALVMACLGVRRKSRALRNDALLAAGLAVVVAIIPLVAKSYRISVTRNCLSQRYGALSRTGPPFPKSLEPPLAASSRLLISHGYWVSDDQQAFEVYYHAFSDSFTMAYPKREWEWRRNQYRVPRSQINPPPNSPPVARLLGSAQPPNSHRP